MTIAKYRLMDLMFLGFIALAVDLIGFFASQSDLLFLYVTLSTPILLIIYFRWGIYGLYVNGAVIVLHTILYRNFEILDMLGYALSILAIGVSMVWFKLTTKGQIRSEVLLLTLYFLTGYLAMFLIQVLVQFVLYDKIEWVILITRNAFNIIIGWVILMIARNQTDFMVDMRKYLLKQIKDREEEHLYES